jgi:hypothetical protein
MAEFTFPAIEAFACSIVQVAVDTCSQITSIAQVAHIAIVALASPTVLSEANAALVATNVCVKLSAHGAREAQRTVASQSVGVANASLTPMFRTSIAVCAVIHTACGVTSIGAKAIPKVPGSTATSMAFVSISGAISTIVHALRVVARRVAHSIQEPI